MQPTVMDKEPIRDVRRAAVELNPQAPRVAMLVFECPAVFHRSRAIAWLGLSSALNVHVTDEALDGLLPLCNSIVLETRESFSVVPLPT
jgi:hypothetical protein